MEVEEEEEAAAEGEEKWEFCVMSSEILWCSNNKGGWFIM